MSERYIYQIANAFQVQVRVRGKRCRECKQRNFIAIRKSFGFKKHGGKGTAMKAAVKWRDKTLRARQL